MREAQMLTLFGGGAKFGLPDGSPFVTKTHVLLKMAGVPYCFERANFRKAPKGKIPYIDDGGALLGDSALIRRHLETNYAAYFDQGLSAAEKATALAFERMCEEHLYWAIVNDRWMIDDNFNKGPRQYFDDAPAPLRPLIATMTRRQVRRNLKGHGLGRHSDGEIALFAAQDLVAISDFLADKSWLMGAQPCGADATVWAMTASCLCPHFEAPVRAIAERHANLKAYRDRGFARWFPEMRTTP
jgi:glutathione S-transferase